VLMKPNERVIAVYEGRVPDQVPLMLDLSHWHKANNKVKFELSGYKGVDPQLVELHKKARAVCYCEMGAFFDVVFDDPQIEVSSNTDEKGVFRTYLKCPLGTLHEERVFEPVSYSYNIRKHLLESIEDFPIVRYIYDRARCVPKFDRIAKWKEALGELAYIYFQLPYSGLGYLISRNFGVEKTCLAMFDAPAEVRSLIDSVNNWGKRVLDAAIDGPFETVIISDNIDANVQNPSMFRDYSCEYYTYLAQSLHEKGKYLAVHVDGEMNGILPVLEECGVDCIDAATPAPMFSLTPEKARMQAGSMILSGGVPATIFGNEAGEKEFDECVKSWLDLKEISPRLIMAAGDQVPIEAPWWKIERLQYLVEEFGKY
jgi:uroporphyrinogen-III decarboxylase